MADGQFFQRGKIQELQEELSSNDKKDPKFTNKRTVLKKIVANMTMGNDMSPLFPDIIACMQIPVLEIKKMVYLYLINYSKSKPDMVLLTVNSFVRDASDSNPLIRALALRTMSYINVDKINDAICEPLRANLKDRDPYVRKTAALCVAKLFANDKELAKSEGFLESLKELLSDGNPTVIANALTALIEIHENNPEFTLTIDMTIASNLLAAINESSEWCQTYILEALMFVTPKDQSDAESLIDRVIPRLQHANSAVVLTAIKILMYFLNYVTDEACVTNVCKKISPTLVTLIGCDPEIQYVALRNALLIIQKRPEVLRNEMKVFFCKYNDPIYVKLSKLEIMFRLATESNVDLMLAELKEYATEVDVDFVRKAVRAIGRCAIKIEKAADKCIDALVDLIQTKVNYVVQEAIVVIKDIFRKYPNRYESIIGTLCENLDNLDETEAKASMIWIIGQYADRIENSADLLNTFLEPFLEEPADVQHSLLTATVKLFIKRPAEGKELIPKVLKWATEEVDNPDVRDRGFMYWRLLSADPVAAKAIVMGANLTISTEADNFEPSLLNALLLHAGTLSSIYHKPPQMIVPNIRPRVGGTSEANISVTSQSGKSPSKPQVAANYVQYNPYSNDIASVRQSGAPAVSNLLDLDISMDTPSSQPTIPSANSAHMNQLNRNIEHMSLGSALGTIGGDLFSLSASTNYVAPKKMVLAANVAKGMEVQATFARRQGQMVMDLVITNRALQPISDFAVQFNKNTFGIVPAGPLKARSPLPPSQSSEASLPMTSNPMTHAQPTQPVNNLQVAIKNNAGIFFFQVLVPVYVMLREDGALPQQEYLKLWKEMSANNTQSVSVEVPVNDVTALRGKLALNNIFTVAERRNENGGAALYLSAKLMDATAFLIEALIEGNGSGVNVTAKCFVAGLLPLFLESFRDIISS